MPSDDRNETSPRLGSLVRKHSLSSGQSSLPPRPAATAAGSSSAFARENMISTRRRSPSPASGHYGRRRIGSSAEKAEESSVASLQQEDSKPTQSFRRIQSLDNPRQLDANTERPTVRRIKSVAGSSNNTGGAEGRRQSRRWTMKGLTTIDGLAQGERSESQSGATTSLATILERKDDNNAQSAREDRPRSRSRSNRRTRNSQSSAIQQEGEENGHCQELLPIRQRVVRRSQSSVCASVASATVASSESSSSGSTSNSRKGNVRKRSSSLGKRSVPRPRGDQAPVTPTRNPPSPVTSDSSLSPPNTKQAMPLPAPPIANVEDSSEESSPNSTTMKTIVSTSKVKRNPKKPRSRRLLRSGSDSVARSMDMTGAIISSCPENDIDEPSTAPSNDVATASTPPPLPVGPKVDHASRPSHALRIAKEAKDLIEDAAGNLPQETTKRRRSFGLSRLARSFSLGSRKQTGSRLSAARKANSMGKSVGAKHPEKSINPARSGDDSTTRSGTERTVSTVSTAQSSDFSSNSGGVDSLSPVPPSSSPVDYKNFSKLLSRLRTDFDLPVYEDDDDDDLEDLRIVRRPASMSCLTTHLELTRARIVIGKDLEEADEDSTMVSIIDAAGMSKNPSERSRSSLSRRRKNREKRSGQSGVSFGSVNVREYERIIGDNPAVSAGVPIGLGWSYSNYLEVDVDIYESSVRKPGPRTRRDFFLTPQNRISILRDEYGCSNDEITKAKELAAEVRYQRQVSIFGEPNQSFQPQTPTAAAATEPPSKRPQKPVYSRTRGSASVRLPMLPQTDNRWDTSCPAVQCVEAGQ